MAARTHPQHLRRWILACALPLLSSVCACARSEAAASEPPRRPSAFEDLAGDRFVARPDGTAFDRRTGVTWQRCPLGTFLDDRGTPEALDDDRCLPSSSAPQTLTWTAAMVAARQIDESGGFAGYSDWRVPGQRELLSIVEARGRDPRIIGGVFPVISLDPFVGSTVYSAVETLSWEAHSRRGVPAAVRVRLVR
jgi:hypothetical protein